MTDVNIINKQQSKFSGVDKYLSAYLLSDENDESTKSLIVDGSSTPKEFTLTAPEGYKYLIYRCFPYLEDGVVAFESGKFGALNALSNGVQIFGKKADDPDVYYQFELWKTNADIMDTMLDFVQSFKGDGSRIGRWTLEKDMGDALVLDTGDVFGAKIQDPMAGLDVFTIKIKGRKIIL